MEDWKRLDESIPDENVVVNTKIHDKYGIRNETKLKRHRGLWFYPDDSMYVYYPPTHWMPEVKKKL